MSVRRGHAGKVDGNHAEIIKALREHAIAAVSIAQVGGGVPDVLCGFRDLTMALEVKMPGAKLTAAEREFHETWPGHIAVVETAEEAITAVVSHAREMGRI